MLISLIHLLAPIVALAVMCTVHLLWCRLQPTAALLNTLFLSGVGGVMAIILAEIMVFAFGEPIFDVLFAAFLVDMPIFAGLAYGYANFINLGQSSVRIRIYRELQLSGSGIKIETLREEYDERRMLHARLDRLVQAGDLKETNGNYRMGKLRLLHIATVIFTLKRIVLGHSSEFDS